MVNSGNHIQMRLSASEILDRAFMMSEQLADQMEGAALSYGLTVPRLKVLFVLGHEGETKQRVLATHLGCSPRQVTALVDALVVSGLVVRHTPPDDRRVRLVSLTGQGRVIVDEVDTARAALAGEIFDGLDDDHIQVFGMLAERVIAQMGAPALPRFARP